MLTIARLSRWSVAYYNDTANQATTAAAMDRHRAGGGLSEYYSEGDTRAPTWLVVGDKKTVGRHTGLDGAALDGGFADTATAAGWLDDGHTPNGATGRRFGTGAVHGFDLTFAAPKSVSLIRALTDDIGEKTAQVAHHTAITAAMEYLYRHAGYTRTHNPETGTKDLHRLPGLVSIAYQHETSRCGDPHLHTHVLVPNRQPRADGALVSLDSKSVHHEAKAAGTIYQAVLRHELHTQLGVEWQPTGDRSGMAELAGITKECLKSWSQRSTRLRQWAANNLALVDGQPNAAQLQAAQKATRQPKPESVPWQQLQAAWRGDARGGLQLDRDAFFAARNARRAGERHTPDGKRHALDAARILGMAERIDKPAFTRADLIEIIGAQLPIDAPNPANMIEKAVDAVAWRITPQRQPHQREGSERFTLDAIAVEEQRIFDLAGKTAVEVPARGPMRCPNHHVRNLSTDQARAITNIAQSPFLVQPLQAPAGAGKTHCLSALHAAARDNYKRVLVLAPTGKAVDEAMRDRAGDEGMTVAKACTTLNNNTSGAKQQRLINYATVVIVDEASMVPTAQLEQLLQAATNAEAKIVLVGDPHQLAPVKARGGIFEHLATELPWAQRLSEIWRMHNPAERHASLALRAGHGNQLRKAIGWYRTHHRLHTGDPITMADDAYRAYLADRAAGKNPLLVADTRETADAINQRLHHTLTQTDAPSVPLARDQHARVGDLIISRANDPTITTYPGPGHHDNDRVDQVRNGNRWRVAGIDTNTNRIAAERLDDRARTVFETDYLREHTTLGYATTVHSAQGATADTCHAILSQTATREATYVAMSRGRQANHAYLPTRDPEHTHQHPTTTDNTVEQIHQVRRGTKHTAANQLRQLLAHDDRPRTMHTEANRHPRNLLPDNVAELLNRHDQHRTSWHTTWRHTNAARHTKQAADQKLTLQRQNRARTQSNDGYSLEL